MQETTGSEPSAEGGAPSEENYITFHDKLAKLFRVKPRKMAKRLRINEGRIGWA